MEWLGLIIFAMVVATIMHPPSQAKKLKARREFYRNRKADYESALPDSFPYVVSDNGYDATIRTGETSWTVKPSHIARKEGIKRHPLIDDSSSYVGDSYRSVMQMKGRQ